MPRRSTALAAVGIPLALALTTSSGAVAATAPHSPPDPAFPVAGPSAGPPAEVAMAFLRERAAEYGVSDADLAELVVLSEYTSAHNDVTHVNLVQHHEGLQVAGSHATVNVLPDGSVLHVAENLVAGLAAARADVELDAPQALVAAAEPLDLPTPDAVRVQRRATGPERATTLSPAGVSDAPVPARLVWQPTADGLRQAWELVVDETGSASVWQVTVDAGTGATLATEDWTDHHDGEALADGLARSPEQRAGRTSATPPLGSREAVEDGSSYEVFAFPAESPNDGDRSVVEEPADASASPFGWHDLDGVAGADDTTTRGNNVHAYTDQDNDGVPDPGSSPDGGAGLDFGFPMDLTEHAQTYRDAAVTNLFYANNVIHDVLAGYGFDERAGNFQATSYSGEGVGGDDVRAEAADGGGANNANFSTPPQDGQRPRMQMYLWPAAQLGQPNAVTIGTGEGATTYAANYARFTPAPTNAGFPGEVRVADDACSAVEAPGAIVVVGATAACTVHAQVVNAEAGGAVAVVVSHDPALTQEREGQTPDDATTAPILSGTMDPAVGIPAVSVSQDDGTRIREQVGDDALAGSVHKAEGHTGIRDGDVENGVIIHEYGHGVSNRLTGGPGINCLSGQEQMGEGWSDFLAITMLLDPEVDDPEVGRGMGPYVRFQDSREGAGIRPRPYTRDMGVQPFTYDRIRTEGWLEGATLAAPHGVGHGWASILWDLDWNLVEEHGFTPDVYAPWDTAGNTRAMQYVVDGLKMQGCAPGFVAGRDGILAADAALGGQDSCMIWTTFARRGLGASAVQGTTGRDDNVEAFDMPAHCDAPGEGVLGDLADGSTVEAGGIAEVELDLGGVGGLRGRDVLKEAHSPASQQVDCTTGAGLQYATTEPTDGAGRRPLSYSPRTRTYTYDWATQEDWAGTCRQLQVVLEDGTQHRAVYRFA